MSDKIKKTFDNLEKGDKIYIVVPENKIVGKKYLDKDHVGNLHYDFYTIKECVIYGIEHRSESEHIISFVFDGEVQTVLIRSYGGKYIRTVVSGTISRRTKIYCSYRNALFTYEFILKEKKKNIESLIEFYNRVNDEMQTQLDLIQEKHEKTHKKQSELESEEKAVHIG